jgi:hypothetical protein
MNGRVFLMMLAAAPAAGCISTTVKITQDKPLEINLNVKIDQQVRVKLDKDVEQMIKANPDIF